jgi:hypothetical protein
MGLGQSLEARPSVAVAHDQSSQAGAVARAHRADQLEAVTVFDA